MSIEFLQFVAGFRIIHSRVSQDTVYIGKEEFYLILLLSFG